MEREEQLSTVIGAIYDATLDPSLWPGALGRAAHYVRGSAAALYSKDAASSAGEVYYDNGVVDPRYTQLYFDKYIKLDPTNTNGTQGGKRDFIGDSKRGTDDIDLRTIDAKTGVSGNQKFKFIGKQDFHDKKGELRYEDKGAKVIVQGDVNGDGKADFEILVKAGSLSAGDFLL